MRGSHMLLKRHADRTLENIRLIKRTAARLSQPPAPEKPDDTKNSVYESSAPKSAQDASTP